ncbi:hypothetical protein D3C85_775690 [compost metagenome]
MFAGLERRGETIEQFGGNVVGITGLLQAWQQDNELVTAQACHGVDVTQLLLETCGNALEQQVAHRVAEAVVDVLEAVQVDEQHGALVVVVGGIGQGQLQAALEQQAVGQAGEWVVVRLVVEARLGVLQRRDVGEHADVVGDLVVAVANGADGEPFGVGVAVLATVPDLPLPVSFTLQLVPHGGVEGAVVLAGGQQAWRLAEGFAFAVAGDFAEGAIDRGDALLGVGDHHAFGGAFEDGRGLEQLFLHLLALGDVAGDGQHAGVVADGDGLGGELAEADLTSFGADGRREVVQAALVADDLDHVFAFGRVGPETEVQGGAVGDFLGAVAGDAAEAVVGFQQ